MIAVLFRPKAVVLCAWVLLSMIPSRSRAENFLNAVTPVEEEVKSNDPAAGTVEDPLRFPRNRKRPTEDTPLTFSFPNHNIEFHRPFGLFHVNKYDKNSEPAVLELQNNNLEILMVFRAKKMDAENLVDLRNFERHLQAEHEKNEAVFSRPTRLEINGVDGIRYLRRSDDNKEITGIYWVAVNADFIYEMIIICKTKNIVEILRYSKTLYEGLKRINPKRIASADIRQAQNKAAAAANPESFFPYRCPKYGLEIHLDNRSYIPLENIAQHNPLAEFGVVRRTPECVLFVMVFPHGDVHINEKAIQAAHLMKIRNNLSLTEGPKRTFGKASCFTYRASTFGEDQVKYYHEFLILSYPRCAYMIMCSSAREDHLSWQIGKFLSGLKISEEGPSREALAPTGFRERHRLADYFNEAGLYYYNMQDYEAALRHIQKAIPLAPDNPVYLSNAQEVMNQMGRYQESLDLIKQYWEKRDLPPLVSANRAWSYCKLERWNEAWKIYQPLFEKGFAREDHFLLYMQSLANDNQFDRMIPALQSFTKRHPSPSAELETANLLRQFEKPKLAAPLLARLHDQFPANETILAHHLRCYLENEDFQTALEKSNKLIERKKHLPIAWYIKAESEFCLKRYAQAKASMQEYLRLCPEDADAKNHLTTISALLSQGNNSLVKEEIPPVPLPPSLIETLRNLPHQPDVPGYGSYTRYSIEAVSYQPGKEQKCTFHDQIKVVDQNSVSQYNTIHFTFNPLYYRLYVNDLIVRNEKQDIVARGNPNDYYVIDRQHADAADFNATLHIPVPSLRPGYTIEIKITRKSLNPEWPLAFHKTLFSQSKPVRFAALYYHGDPKDVSHVTKHLAEPKAVRDGLLWCAENPPVFTPEAMIPRLESFLPYVCLSDAKDNWPALLRDYLDEIKPTLAVSEKIKSLANELTANAKSTEEKIAILAEYVQKTLTYNAIAFGRRARIPNPTDVILANRYGDCKDHSLLLTQLLRACAIPAKLVLVNTGETIEENLPSMDQFDHMIVMVDLPGRPRFLDMTNKEFDLNQPVPTGLAGYRVLVLDAENGKLQTIPQYSPDSDHVRIQRSIHMINATDIRVRETLFLRGYSAESMRRSFKSEHTADHKKFLQSFLNNYVRSARLISFDAHNIKDNQKPFSLDWEYEVPEQGRPEQGRIQLAMPCVWEQFYIMPDSVPERKNPFRILFPVKVDSQVTVHPAVEYSLCPMARMPETNTTKYCYWRHAANLAKNQLRTNLSFHCQRGVFESKEYETFRGQAIRALKPIELSVYLRKQAETSAFSKEFPAPAK
ncbi:MAG: DUF3857 domain-containing protein [Phycisphaerae bacterium]|nr:DUF3857 domain-containing protein [Phycisphaerae bacterium]